MPNLVQGFVVNNGDVASASYLNSWFSTGGITVSSGHALIGNSTGTTGTLGTSNWQEITMGQGLTLASGTLSVGTLTTLGVSGDTQSQILGVTGQSSIYGVEIAGVAVPGAGTFGGTLYINGTVTATASSQTIILTQQIGSVPGASSFLGTVFHGVDLYPPGQAFATSDLTLKNIMLYVHAPRGGQSASGQANLVNYGVYSESAVYAGSLQLGVSFTAGTAVASGYLTVYDANGVLRKINCT